jgi:hypothetical protein
VHERIQGPLYPLTLLEIVQAVKYVEERAHGVFVAPDRSDQVALSQIDCAANGLTDDYQPVRILFWILRTRNVQVLWLVTALNDKVAVQTDCTTFVLWVLLSIARTFRVIDLG